MTCYCSWINVDTKTIDIYQVQFAKYWKFVCFYFPPFLNTPCIWVFGWLFGFSAKRDDFGYFIRSHSLIFSIITLQTKPMNHIAQSLWVVVIFRIWIRSTSWYLIKSFSLMCIYNVQRNVCCNVHILDQLKGLLFNVSRVAQCLVLTQFNYIENSIFRYLDGIHVSTINHDVSVYVNGSLIRKAKSLRCLSILFIFRLPITICMEAIDWFNYIVES